MAHQICLALKFSLSFFSLFLEFKKLEIRENCLAINIHHRTKSTAFHSEFLNRLGLYSNQCSVFLSCKNRINLMLVILDHLQATLLSSDTCL